MDANYKVTLCDIGLVIEKLIGNGYLSDYSKRDFRAKYSKLNDKKVNKRYNFKKIKK